MISHLPLKDKQSFPHHEPPIPCLLGSPLVGSRRRLKDVLLQAHYKSANSASYLALLLDALNMNFSACSYMCHSSDAMINPTPLPSLVTYPTTYSILEVSLPTLGSYSIEHLTMKLAKIWALMALLVLLLILY